MIKEGLSNYFWDVIVSHHHVLLPADGRWRNRRLEDKGYGDVVELSQELQSVALTWNKKERETGGNVFKITVKFIHDG